MVLLVALKEKKPEEEAQQRQRLCGWKGLWLIERTVTVELRGAAAG